MTEVAKRKASLLVIDLDNTVWDWFDAWYKSFTALLEGLEEATGLPRGDLETDIRPIHQARFTSEYSWLVEELEVLKKFVGEDQNLRGRFNDALHRQNSARKSATRLYPGVMETLKHVKSAGVPIVAYTESIAYWTEWRIRQLGLDGVIDRLYSSPDHDFPKGLSIEEMRMLPQEDYGLKITQHDHVPKGVLKPDPSILLEIVAAYNVPLSEVVYVGDSLMKDVAMAKAVGTVDVYAKYGDSHRDPRYAQLQRVSHWPDAAVAKEQMHEHPEPSYVLDKDFGQVLDFFEFVA
jgi:phosphoglycolate phosphatase